MIVISINNKIFILFFITHGYYYNRKKKEKKSNLENILMEKNHKLYRDLVKTEIE